MITGHGRLKLRDGRGVEVAHQFASEYDDRRAGNLLFDTTAYHDGLFCTRLILDCDDGRCIALVVMNRSDQHLAVAGRVLECPVDAA